MKNYRARYKGADYYAEAIAPEVCARFMRMRGDIVHVHWRNGYLRHDANVRRVIPARVFGRLARGLARQWGESETRVYRMMREQQSRTPRQVRENLAQLGQQLMPEWAQDVFPANEEVTRSLRNALSSGVASGVITMPGRILVVGNPQRARHFSERWIAPRGIFLDEMPSPGEPWVGAPVNEEAERALEECRVRSHRRARLDGHNETLPRRAEGEADESYARRCREFMASPAPEPAARIVSHDSFYATALGMPWPDPDQSEAVRELEAEPLSVIEWARRFSFLFEEEIPPDPDISSHRRQLREELNRRPGRNRWEQAGDWVTEGLQPAPDGAAAREGRWSDAGVDSDTDEMLRMFRDPITARGFWAQRAYQALAARELAESADVTDGSPEYMQQLVARATDDTVALWIRLWGLPEGATRADLHRRVLEPGPGELVAPADARELSRALLADDREFMRRVQSPQNAGEVEYHDGHEEPLEDSAWFAELAATTERRMAEEGPEPEGKWTPLNEEETEP